MGTITFEPALVRRYVLELLGGRYKQLSFLLRWPEESVSFSEKLIGVDFLGWLRQNYPESPLAMVQSENVNVIAITRELQRQIPGCQVNYETTNEDVGWGWVAVRSRMVQLPPIKELINVNHV